MSRSKNTPHDKSIIDGKNPFHTEIERLQFMIDWCEVTAMIYDIAVDTAKRDERLAEAEKYRQMIVRIARRLGVKYERLEGKKAEKRANAKAAVEFVWRKSGDNLNPGNGRCYAGSGVRGIIE